MADQSTGERIARLEGGLNGMQEQMHMLRERFHALCSANPRSRNWTAGSMAIAGVLIGAIGGSTALIASLMVALKYLETAP